MRQITILLLLFFCNIYFCQNVIDGVYIKENTVRPTPLITKAAQINVLVPALRDSDFRKKLVEKAHKNKALYLNKIDNSEQFVLFNANPQNLFDSAGYFNPYHHGKISDTLSYYDFPWLAYSIDSSKTKIDEYLNLNYYCNYNGSVSALNKMIEPFYFKKTEVTNAEYREFVDYVRDSIARRLLADLYPEQFLLNPSANNQSALSWKNKVDWNSKIADYKAILNYFYLPENERFYKRREFDTRKLNFEYYFIDEKGVKQKDIINVYPDTACWTNDFSYSYNEPMTNMYFWHPAYNDYPVVGVSWLQAKAFLIWKTEQENKKLSAQKKSFRIVYDLPSHAEWQMASSSFTFKNKPYEFSPNSKYVLDNSFLFDLAFEKSGIYVEEIKRVTIDSTLREMNDKVTGIFMPPTSFKETDLIEIKDSVIKRNGKTYNLRLTQRVFKINRINQYYSNLYSQNRFYGNFIVDGSFHTAKSEIKKGQTEITSFKLENGKYVKYKTPASENILQQIDGNGICFMGANVSEWLKNDYSEIRPAINWRLNYLLALNTADSKFTYELEKQFNETNNAQGKLVQGSNWFDERFSDRLGKNSVGNNAKKFIDKEKAHSTIGFRYVCRLLLVSNLESVKK